MDIDYAHNISMCITVYVDVYAYAYTVFHIIKLLVLLDWLA